MRLPGISLTILALAFALPGAGSLALPGGGSLTLPGERSFALPGGGSLTLPGAGPLGAQTVHAGGHLSYGFEDWSELGLGVRGGYLLTPEIAGSIEVTRYFNGIDGLSFWELNLNGHYRFEVERDFTPYAGGGINYARFSLVRADVVGDIDESTSEVGLNLLGGAFTDLDNDVRVFGELRFVLGELDHLVISAGAAIPVR